jgi:hypothetical protein
MTHELSFLPNFKAKKFLSRPRRVSRDKAEVRFKRILKAHGEGVGSRDGLADLKTLPRREADRPRKSPADHRALDLGVLAAFTWTCPTRVTVLVLILVYIAVSGP